MKKYFALLLLLLLTGISFAAQNGGVVVKAKSADYATTSGSSTSSAYATLSGTATNAGYATLSGTATNAGTANYATLSGTATNAGYAILTATASICTGNSATASYATLAGTSSTGAYAVLSGTSSVCSGAAASNVLKAGDTMTGVLTIEGLDVPPTKVAAFRMAGGTSPFTVASGTVVTNLNSDQLDGQHGSYYGALSGGQTWSGVNTFEAALTTVATLASTTITAGAITDSGLTINRIPYASTGGLLADSANMTFTADTLNVIGTVDATSFSGDGSHLTGIQHGTLLYYLRSYASDIGTYFAITPDYDTASPEVPIAKASIAAGDSIKYFATPSGYPGLSILPDEPWQIHFHAARTTGNKSVTIKAQLIKRSGTTNILISTSEATPAITNSSLAYDIHGLIPTGTTIEATDRLVVNLFAFSVGSGTTTDITVYIEGPDISHLEVPGPVVSTANFVPYTGATSGVNLGTHLLTTTGTMTASTFYGSAAGLTNFPTVPYATLAGTASTAAYSTLTATASTCTGNAATASYATLSGTSSTAAYATLTATASTCTGTIAPTTGGTGLTTYTTGDVIYANTTNSIAKLNIGSAGQALFSRGGIPSWESPALGSVTQVSTGTGLIGGPITTTGIVSIDATKVCTGSASATDKAVPRFNGTSGKILQDSGVTIDDANTMAIAGQLVITGASRCRWTSSTGVTTGTTATFDADTETYDNLNELASSGIFTAAQSGYYLCHINLLSNGWTDGGTENVYIFQNGVYYDTSSTSTISHQADGRTTDIHLTDIVYCPAGQTIQFYVNHSKSTTVTFTGYAWIHRIS